MWLLKFWPCLLLLALSLGPVQRVTACSCAPKHPQIIFCKSDFVAVVKVKRRIMVSEDEVAYKVKVNKVFKSTPKFDVIQEQGVLRSSPSEEMCGVNLNVGDTYVVSGRMIAGKARISLCGIASRWADVNSRQRKGFRQLYRRGCVCEIMYTPWTRKGAVFESVGGKRCLWESMPGPQDCQQKYGVCMVGPAGCCWIPSVPYKNCIKEYQRQREQQRLREP